MIVGLLVLALALAVSLLGTLAALRRCYDHRREPLTRFRPSASLRA